MSSHSRALMVPWSSSHPFRLRIAEPLPSAGASADILLHLDLPHRPPRVSPARGPPQGELHLDQTPAFDLAAPEPMPEFEFDQSDPHDWEV